MVFKRKFVKRKPRRKTKNLKAIIKKVIRNESERKFLTKADFNLNLTNMAIYSNTLNVVGSGDAFNERVGDKVSPNMLSIRYLINHAITTNAAIVRVYVIQALQDTFPINLPVTPIDLMPTLRTSLRTYRKLYDRSYDMSLGVNGDVINQIAIRVPKMIDSNRYTGPSILLGEIRLIFVTDNIDANAIFIEFTSRFYFTDD